MTASSSTASSGGDQSSTTDSRWFIIGIAVAIVGFLMLGSWWWCCCRRRTLKRFNGSRDGHSIEYVDCELTPELMAIVADSAHRSSSATRFGNRLFYYLPGITSVPSMDVFDQFSTNSAQKSSSPATTTATTTIMGSSPLDDALQVPVMCDTSDELKRNALVIEQCRLSPESIVGGGELLRAGSFTSAFRTTLQLEGQDHHQVVVRRLLPELADQQVYRQAFMADVALSAVLVHPRIVAFVGFYDPTHRVYDLDASPSSSFMLPQAQLSAVTEYMANGTLRDLLTLRSRDTHDFGWFHSISVLKTKAQLALDIVDALVYLQSRPAGTSTPLHPPELKAQGVLLSELYDAKLCTFGIRRAVGIQATHSRSDFSVAWLAPELLRGEPRSEQADVYALGVLLTELDTCKLPFEAGVDMDDRMDEQRQLALLVSSGCIRPAVSMDCPVQIQELVMRCLSFSPQQRPPAIEVQHTLRKLINGTSICNSSPNSLLSNVPSLYSTPGPCITTLSALFTP
uniref:Protein kinase domain-containing protein n=1 Tax=Hyaloperonospora arabidopsidis (strain Emoy2) TaxID=559515 RepID=M4B6A0_HYAAE